MFAVNVASSGSLQQETQKLLAVWDIVLVRNEFIKKKNERKKLEYFYGRKKFGKKRKKISLE